MNFVFKLFFWRMAGNDEHSKPFSTHMGYFAHALPIKRKFIFHQPDQQWRISQFEHPLGDLSRGWFGNFHMGVSLRAG
jgi:hypothetical protein